MRLGSITIVITVALLGSTDAFLGFPGHRATGFVAEKLLTPVAYDNVRNILLPDETLSSVSTFADEYLYAPGGEGSWSRTLHFVNQFPDWTCDYDPKFCTNEFCLVSAITNYTSRLAAHLDTSNFDLKMLMHFIGDFHTPPHFGFLSDRGATRLRGTFFGRDRSIHQIWDRDMLDERLRRDFGRSEELFFDYLLSAVRPGGKFYNQSRAWTECSDSHPVSSCIMDWSKEVAKLVCELSYQHHDGTPVKPGFEFNDQDYEARIDEKERLIAMAAVRMASILNFLFK